MNVIIRSKKVIILVIPLFFYSLLACREYSSLFSIPSYLKNVTHSSATISWEWNKPEKSTLLFGTSIHYTDTLLIDLSTICNVKLTNLKENSKYYYSIFIGNKPVLQEPETYYFYTAPKDTRESISIAVIGDTRTDDESFASDHKAVINSIKKYTFPSFLIHLGDMVDITANKPWINFFSIQSPLLKNCPIYPVRGNSDGSVDQFIERFLKSGTNSWYSFNYGPVFCINLDIPFDRSTNYYKKNIGPESKQYKWLIKQLQSTERKDCPFTIISFFAPLFSPSGKSSKYLLSLLTPLFENYKVDLVLNGSDHCLSFAQYSNVSYIISGGGGASLQPSTKKRPPQVIETKYIFHHLRISVHFPTMRIKGIDNLGTVFFSHDIHHNPNLNLNNMNNEKIGKPRLIIYGSDDCDECREIKLNIVPQIQAKYGNKLDEIKFVDIDIQNNFVNYQQLESNIDNRKHSFPVIQIGNELLSGSDLTFDNIVLVLDQIISNHKVHSQIKSLLPQNYVLLLISLLITIILLFIFLFYKK